MAVEASRRLEADGIHANVVALTSPRACYAGWRHEVGALVRGAPPAPTWLRELFPAGDLDGEVPVVSVLDGHSHALAWLGTVLGVPHVPLGVDAFGQSGEVGRTQCGRLGDDGPVDGALQLVGLHLA